MSDRSTTGAVRGQRGAADGLVHISEVLSTIGMEPKSTQISDDAWERVVWGVVDIAGSRGGSDERGERARRATHELCGAFVSSETWEIVHGLLRLPEPVLRVVVACAQTLTGIVYGAVPQHRERRARLLSTLLREAEAASGERRAA